MGKNIGGRSKATKIVFLKDTRLIRNLSKREADVFMKVANYAMKSGDRYYLFKGNDDDKFNKEYGISYMDIAMLKEIGLIQSGEFVNHQYIQQATDLQRILIAGSIIVFIKIKANTPTVQMPVDVFSNAGNELLKLLKTTPPLDYVKYFANSIKNENVDTKYANIIAFEGGNIRHTKPLLDL